MSEERKRQPEEVAISFDIDLLVFFKDAFRGLAKLWWAVLALTVAAALVSFGMSIRSYRPMYRASASFTVETYTNVEGYTFYYDARTASQMAITFPYLLDSDLLLDRVKTELGVTYLNGVPRAEVIANSNLFTLSVTSSAPQDAYDILQALIHNYPAVSEYVIGKTKLNMIESPQLPTQPYNRAEKLTDTLKGGAVGFFGGTCTGGTVCPYQRHGAKSL